MAKDNPHDEIFKQVESVKENAIDFIRGTFPEHIVHKLDFTTLELQNTSYTDKKLKKYFSDLVYNCRFNGSEINISLLFEHKSYVVDYPHLQILQYILNIFESRIKAKESLIPVIPILFYHGEEKWKGRDMYSYFDNIDGDLKPFIPNFNYILTDIGNYSDKKIESELFKRDANKILMLFMKNIKDEKLLIHSLSDILKIGKVYYTTEEGRSFLTSIIIYLLKSVDCNVDDVADMMENIIHGGGEFIMTTAMRLELKGEKRGITKGITQGIDKGVKITALNMKSKGFSDRDISIATNLTISDIEKL